VHHPVALGDAGAARAVEADRVDLVEVCHGAVAVGEVADLAARRHVSVHRVDRLEHDQLRPVAGLLKQLLQVLEIVVAEDLLRAGG
jgi:hypothetical protein